ncbi:MAG TPA: hypothetical protein VJO33_00135 [Gemmatimonadaceae bacterium]|nr:hypothetical protein [Gemmatimonadaceae bacterium]
MSLSNWRWYHILFVWIIVIAGCVAVFRNKAHTMEAKSDSGGLVGVGAPLSLIVICAVVLVVLIVMTAKWMRTR